MSANSGATEFVGVSFDAASRLEEVFQLAQVALVNEPRVDRLAAATAKAGRIAGSRGCDGQTWRAIEPRCLVPGDDAARAALRTVTMEYRAGERSSVLVRLPTGNTAKRQELEREARP